MTKKIDWEPSELKASFRVSELALKNEQKIKTFKARLSQSRVQSPFLFLFSFFPFFKNGVKEKGRLEEEGILKEEKWSFLLGDGFQMQLKDEGGIRERRNHERTCDLGFGVLIGVVGTQKEEGFGFEMRRLGHGHVQVNSYSADF